MQNQLKGQKNKTPQNELASKASMRCKKVLTKDGPEVFQTKKKLHVSQN